MSISKLPANIDPVKYPPQSPVRVRASRRVSRNLLLDLPITWRLALGFLLAALIAASAASITGIQRAQSLNNQSEFYQSLLRVNTSLTTGSGFLQLMNNKVHETLTDAAVPNPSQETLNTDQAAIQGLTTRYDNILADYLQNNILDKHPDQVAILTEGGHGIQISQQRTLIGSTLRTWQVYRSAQQSVLQDVTANLLNNANALERSQAEPTNADALSALRALIQFDSRLATSVQDAALVEQQSQLITTILASVAAFLGVAIVGWIISRTLVQRLLQLRRVTQTVEQGQISTRVEVVGRDEIANVSASVNAMLDTIVGLLEESGKQRDALTNAASHLFSDMRVVSAGDLRINAPVSDDPIGLLANAFNFTVGRFRRFVLRTQSTIEQLDVIAHQEAERIDTFANIIQVQMNATGTTGPIAPVPTSPLRRNVGAEANMGTLGVGETSDAAFIIQSQARQARTQLLQLAKESANQFRLLQESAEQINKTIVRIRGMYMSSSGQMNTGFAKLPPGQNPQNQVQLQELFNLETSLQNLSGEWQELQRKIVKGLMDLEGVLKPLSAASTRLGSGEQGSRNAQFPSASPVATQQIQDLTRSAQNFTQEMSALTRRLMAMVQEMRTSVEPFRLDAPEPTNSGPLSVPDVDEFNVKVSQFTRRRTESPVL